MTTNDRVFARTQNELGLSSFDAWEMEKAIGAFADAASADTSNPEYRLNLARAYARKGDFDHAMQALGEYLRVETNQDVAARYERLFSTAFDEVEAIMIAKMQDLHMTMPQMGKGIQMWLEYRITIGRRPLRIPKPELWAAAIAYAVAKVNFLGMKRRDVAELFQVNPSSLTDKFNELVKTLDIMPADYRYFVGKKNPLDKLVEAARLLEELDRQFQAEE